VGLYQNIVRNVIAHIGIKIGLIKEMPEIGEIQSGSKIGKDRCRYIYLECPVCKNKRWVLLTLAKKSNYEVYCAKSGCLQTHRAELRYKNDPTYWGGIGEPSLGMKTWARNIGYTSNSTYIYDECPTCKFKIWRTRQQLGRLCGKCSDIERGNKYRGKGSHRWINGRYIDSRGYVIIRIQPDDPYYKMSKSGAILEHRYLYAKEIAHRCLESWEVVHHINHDRGDNKLENFGLLTPETHHPYNILQTQVNRFRQEIINLRTINASLEAENVVLKKQLEESKIIDKCK
jgi:hypothetical protein